jgi:hypothetical protein
VPGLARTKAVMPWTNASIAPCGEGYRKAPEHARDQLALDQDAASPAKTV